jgi:hypothetical protein
MRTVCATFCDVSKIALAHSRRVVTAFMNTTTTPTARSNAPPSPTEGSSHTCSRLERKPAIGRTASLRFGRGCRCSWRVDAKRSEEGAKVSHRVGTLRLAFRTSAT